MAYVRLQVLGGLTVTVGGHLLALARSCRPILGYLVTHRQRQVSRVELAEALWADHDADHALRCLSTALWRLKRATGDSACLIAFHGGEMVSFNWAAPAWVDSVALEMRLTPLLQRKPEAMTRDDIRRLERGAGLYRGDYLAGVDQEWAWLERQRIRTLYCDGLYHLLLAHASAAQWHRVLLWGQRLNREEPLREDVHRLLIEAYVKTGNRASAAAQYQHCARALAADLGIEPMAETQALYRELVRGTTPRPTSQIIAVPPPLESVRRRIGRVRRVLVASQQQLDKALDSLAAPSKTR